MLAGPTGPKSGQALFQFEDLSASQDAVPGSAFFRIAGLAALPSLGRPLLIVVSFCLVVLDCIANVP